MEIDDAVLVVSLAGVPWLAKWVFDRFVRRADAREERREHELERRDHETASKLDALLAKVGLLESEMRVIGERISTQSAGVSEAKSRIDGISANYGPRLAALEQAVVEVKTRLTMIETRRDRS